MVADDRVRSEELSTDRLSPDQADADLVGQRLSVRAVAVLASEKREYIVADV